MGSSCPLLSSPTGNDPAFPKLALLAHSHTGGHGASFGSAITESLLPEKSYSVVKEHRAAGVKLLPAPAREGLSGLEAPLNIQRTFLLENLVLPEKKFLKTSPPY